MKIKILVLVCLIGIFIFWGIVGNQIVIKGRDPGYVWGKFYESYYGMKYAEKERDLELAGKMLESNWKWFDKLIEFKLIRPIPIKEYQKDPNLYKVINRASYDSGGLIPFDGNIYVDSLESQ